MLAAVDITLDEAELTAAELRAQLDRERGKLRAMQEIAQALGSTLDLEELMALLLARIARIMDADQAILYVVDQDSSQLWARYGQSGRPQEIRLRLGQGLAGWVAKNGRPLNVKDAYQDVRFDAEWDRRTGYRTGSALCVPIKNHHVSTIGVLQVLNKRSGYFTLDDEGMLGALASQVAVSLENSKLFLSVVGKNMELLETKEQLEHKVRELDVLFEIAQVSATAQRLDDVLEGVLARAMHAIDAEAGSILLADEQTGDLRFRCAVGGDPEAVRRLTIGADQGICGWVAANGQPQIVNDVENDPRHSTTIAKEVGYHPRSLLCVPLNLDGPRGPRGALELLNKAHGRGSFTEDDLRLAMLIAGHIATAIALAQGREKREQQDRLSTIGQLLSGVVHDLRGPMTVIKGYAKMIENEGDGAQRAAFGEAILRQVEAVNAMTGEILAFARGATSILVSKVYLKPFFAELTEHLQLELEGKNVELELQLYDRGVAWFDQHKIRRAVHNLVRNAGQALGQTGGGRVVLSVARGAAEHPGALVIRCTDNGPGVPDAIRNRVFESFTTHGKPDGSGLGLAIVRKVVADHGGTVELKSRPGETVFTLVLPQDRFKESIAPPVGPEERQVQA
jgi:signal transduction histidine kinase